MNKSLAIIIILGLFFSVRYYVQSSQEQETMGYEKVQRDLDNIKNWLNSKNGCLKYLSNYVIVGVNKGLFTNGCKKALKYV